MLNTEEECAELRRVFAEKLRLAVLGSDGDNLPSPGEGFREKFFSFEAGFTVLNSAAFGSLPNPLRDLQARWRQQIELEPYRFHKYYMPRLMKLVMEDVRKYFGVSEEHELILTKNTSAGIYSVFRSLKPLNAGDVILVSLGNSTGTTISATIPA